MVEKNIERKTIMEIPYIDEPNNDEVKKYLDTWDRLENYVNQESSLDELFIKLLPKNERIEDILIKASTLNDFYSTNIFSIYPMAKHIKELHIDDRLKKGDLSLVSDIGHIVINKKEKYFYSFASKYCSHHNPEAFPIYDSYVEKILMHFKRIDKFETFKKDDLKDYVRFNEILIAFKNHYGIDQYGLKDLDRYLWQLGKEFYPNNYKKK